MAKLIGLPAVARARLPPDREAPQGLTGGPQLGARARRGGVTRDEMRVRLVQPHEELSVGFHQRCTWGPVV